MAPHQAKRYKIRSGAERAKSRLKECYGASNVMVKGHKEEQATTSMLSTLPWIPSRRQALQTDTIQ